MKMTLENMSPQSFGEAMEKGEEIGREKGISEVATNLVRLGYETDEICRMTNLDRDAVEAIRQASTYR